MKFKSKLFLSHALCITMALSLLGFFIHEGLKKDITEQFIERYQSVNEILADTLIQLETSTELLSQTAVQYVYELEKKGLPSEEALKSLKDDLNVGLICITDKEGKFLRDTEETVEERPASLFMFCDKYRELLTGERAIEKTPILPSYNPKAPYKFTMIPNHDKTRILEVGIQLSFIGDVLRKTLQSDKHIESIGLFSPRGTTLGFITSNGQALYGTDSKVETGSLEPGYRIEENNKLVIIKKVNAPSSMCCECVMKNVADPSGGYFYLLRTEVSVTPLLESIVSLRRNILILFGLALLIALILSLKLSKVLTKEINHLNLYVRKVIKSGNLEDQFAVSGKDEVAELGRNFNQMIHVLDESQKDILKAEKLRSVAQLATQVAHDIRSPLAALEYVSQNAKALPEDLRSLTQNATTRIKDIANHLLEMNKKADATDELVSEMLSEIIDLAVSEKRINLETSAKCQIEFQMDEGSYGIFAKVRRSDLSRVLSNIMNNSLEAISEQGKISIRLTERSGQAEISIKDNGKGIPAEVLGRVTENEFSHGKKGGNGLGLFHAKKMVESWGGSLKIESLENSGTEVFIRIPLADPARWFVPQIDVEKKSEIVILDDDGSIHQLWAKRFQDLGIDPSKVTTFTRLEDLQAWKNAQTESRLQHVIFLVDFELFGSEKSGLDFIEENGLSKSSYLVTNRNNDRSVVSRCLESGTRLIPKTLVMALPLRRR